MRQIDSVSALQLIVERSRTTVAVGQHGSMTFVNPASFVKLRSRPELLQPIDSIGCDGTLAVLALRVIGVRVGRRSMDLTSLATRVFEDAAREERSVYLLGSGLGVADDAANVLQRLFPGWTLAGTRAGFFDDVESEDLAVQEILNSGAHVVLIGMGAIRQEEFMLKLMTSGFSGSAYTCGAFLQQTAYKQGEYYPSWVNRWNLRFAFRLYQNPRLIFRYTVTYS